MKPLFVLIFGITALMILYFGYIIAKYRFRVQDVEDTLKRRNNILLYIAVMAGVLGAGLALLSYYQSIKKPEFLINLVNEHGNYSETMGGELFVEKYSNRDIRYAFSIPTTWTFEIVNNGERTAKNISIKLLFDNISFENEYIYDYKTTDHQRGIGGWQGLLFTGGLDILPGESITLPYLPFEGQAHLNNALELDQPAIDINDFKIKVYIYADDVIRFEKVYNCKIRNPDHGEYNIENDNQKFEDILHKICDIGLISTYEFNCNHNQVLKIMDTISEEDLKFAYFYCLKRINSENAYNMKKFVLVFGRGYYWKSISDYKAVESMIQNDIWAETKLHIEAI